jgi:hypothetical protein
VKLAIAIVAVILARRADADVVPPKKVPDFGCFAWSKAQRRVACVVGARGFWGGGTRVELAFIALDPAAPEIESLVLVDTGDEESRGPDDLAPETVMRVADALRGFTPLTPRARTRTKWKKDHLVAGPPISVGGITFKMTLDPVPPLSVAPAFHAVITAANVSLYDDTNAFSGFEVRAFAIGGVVIVDAMHSIGDEGTYGSFGSAWRCIGKICS